MGKVVKKLVIAAAIIGLSFVGLPPQVSAALFATGASMALATVSTALFAPKLTKAQMTRLTPTLDPQAYRKFVLGNTAMNTDIRYYEPSGTNQEYIDYILATSAHEVESIDEIWFDDRLAWSASSGVQSFYSGYLTVNTRTVGTAANYIPINGGWVWGSSARLTGCSYVHIRIKRTGNVKASESPLVNGLPNRVTIKGNGAKLYDPRLDGTVSGGSGAMRANDQTTWGTANSTNRDNPALQLLWFLLGWKINGKLSVGCGVPPSRIDLPSFITAANICDEAIALAAGGTQPRYRTAGVGSDADSRMDIIQLFLSSMNGALRDANGKLSLQVMKNDLATPVLTFSDSDILDDFNWTQTRGLDESINAIHGKYTDPSNNSLFQPVEYPTISITSVDGIERMQTLELPWVQDGNRAQRIAKQVLQRAQYKGIFTATFTVKALGCEVGDIVYLSFEPLGWANKPFRVLKQQISATGQIPMTLIEENAAIYAWDRDESAVVTPTAPTVYNPLNSPFILAAAQASETANWSEVVDDNGARPEDYATYGANWNSNISRRPTELTDGRVSLAINGSGDINTNRVSTVSIQSNAVTSTSFAQTSGAIGSTSAEITLQSLTVTTSGGPLIISFSALGYAQAGGAGAFGSNFRVARDTTNLRATMQMQATAQASGDRLPLMFNIPIVDQPSAGTYTYYFYAQPNGIAGTGINFGTHRAIEVKELKR